ncbi:extracellular matrix regulator RemB [Pelotomaculum propionicicum]|uniref:DUF370 domain-containing protein n=1 Tax=Pelotomaculum propionicicum TaxID=258475 RepID=A0A4Y7RYA6_9FIRM|nr:extracellular matrix/biofilm biosynthesis regulator RemA family protein [Pelotomaculum propionicicum]NLI14097.1 DUF370 domain-containing protein [Peptococcaceae bacterium]TEB13716.1 hypothetical protein Pmgp_00119 [Pelotomaculum propionicicum]
MFLHLGGDVVVSKEDIIAILDVRTRQAPITREFIEIARDEGFIKNIYDQEKEKSFVITTRDIYMSPISCVTLKKRAESFLDY